MSKKRKSWWPKQKDWWETEPTDWKRSAGSDILIVTTKHRYATLQPNGHVWVRSRAWGDRGNPLVATAYNLRSLIASLEALLAVAEEHFGEDWAKD